VPADAAGGVVKITHNVALTFIQFLFRSISFRRYFGFWIADWGLGICCIALLYHFLLN
jgi:hypothetical protein